MDDEPVVTPAPAPTEVLGNDPTVRTPEGTIKDPALETKTPSSTPEEKPSTEVKAEAKAEPGKVPEKYELKAPEGYTIDPKVVEEATPIFKELGLSQDQAQKLTDIWNKHSIEAQDAALKGMEATRTEWRSTVAKDPALGDGKADLRPETKANISKAFDAIGDAKQVTALKEALDFTGAGDHPAIVAAFNAWGKLLSEGTLVKGGGPAPTGQAAPGAGPRSAAAAMYPNLPTSSKA